MTREQLEAPSPSLKRRTHRPREINKSLTAYMDGYVYFVLLIGAISLMGFNIIVSSTRVRRTIIFSSYFAFSCVLEHKFADFGGLRVRCELCSVSMSFLLQ